MSDDLGRDRWAHPQTPLLRIDRLRFRFEALEPVRLPIFAGSAWRGLLGSSLRRVACVTGQPECIGCLVRGQCVYPRLFEAPPPGPDASVRYQVPPHPYVLEPVVGGPRDIAEGGPLILGINLIGSARDLLPYVIEALAVAGERGIGASRARFALRELRQETSPGAGVWCRIYSDTGGTLEPLRGDPDHPPACPEAVRLRLETPLRLKHHGRLVGPRDLTAAALLRAVTARTALLIQHHAPDAGTLDSDRLYQAMHRVEIRGRRLRWQDWTRYSSRQQTEMQFGGLLGELTLAGPGLAPLWPLLWQAQWTLIGKGTSFGLGRCRIEPATAIADD